MPLTRSHRLAFDEGGSGAWTSRRILLTAATSPGNSVARGARSWHLDHVAFARRLPIALTILASCRGVGSTSDRAATQLGSGSASEVTTLIAAQGSSSQSAVPPRAELVAVPPEIAAKVGLREVVRGLRRPVLLVVAPGDVRRRWFEQHTGAVRIVENGTLSKTPFVTIGGLSTGNEQGLLGLAFHPAFAKNGKLYVNYTTTNKATHIDEYTVSSSDPDRVDAATRRQIAVIAQPYSNHNGGHLVFGPDGKLYTGMGDGGAANDPHDNGQNASSLLGKLLRLDVDAQGSEPEIVHIGLRNPWRFAFDEKTGDLLIGDVGQNLWEYVHGVAAGDTRRHNFGWNIVEGNHCFDAESGRGKATCDRTGLTPPLVEYGHDEGCSITGGFVYRGTALPELAGRYFYADYCTGLLRSFVWTHGAVRDHWDWKSKIDTNGVLRNVSSFGVDHDGELYIVSLDGTIFKIVPVR
jgi:glucose/arabinose dehydrogenase